MEVVDNMRFLVVAIDGIGAYLHFASRCSSCENKLLNVRVRLTFLKFFLVEMQVFEFAPRRSPSGYLTWKISNSVAPSVSTNSFLDCCTASILLKILSSSKFFDCVNSSQIGESSLLLVL